MTDGSGSTRASYHYVERGRLRVGFDSEKMYSKLQKFPMERLTLPKLTTPQYEVPKFIVMG